MKLKTKKSLAKRIKITKTGKLKKRRAFRSHLMSSKNKKRKRKFSRMFDVNASDEKTIKKLLPYS